ncbi:MAG: Ig-like domain-containing protein, partial [Candidatus Eisenbacteria bacterium]|nr:Ig-like domain-containing protein [Candidatus Eisenbacteria bacterium]
GSQVLFYLDGALVQGVGGHGSPNIGTDGVLYFGGSPGSIHYLGQLDEVRIWNRRRTGAEIADSYLSRLVGDEIGLVSYWPMDEGAGTATADLASYHQNAVRTGGVYWADNGGAPVQVCGLTDIEGNYTISKLHYGEATTFQVIPSLGERTFDPAFKAITLDEETPIQNEIGFLDITSFALAGNLALEGYDGCVVEGVQIMVDGEFAGVSDPEGNFTVAAQPGTRVITPVLEGRTFTPTSRTYEVSQDIGGIEFRDTTERALSGKVGGGCGLAIGTVTLEIAAENGCLDPIQVESGSDYEILLPGQSYLVRVADVQDVPSALDRADILAFFENLGAVAVDLSSEDQTLDFTYRAPVTISLTGLPSPACDGQNLSDPETGVSFPAVPVIAQGDSAVVTINVFEDYGNGNTCPVDSALVTIFDEIQDIEDEPVTVTVIDGVASYTVRGNTPNTNPGRIDSAGNDRSYQKSITAFAEIPGLDPIQTTEWVIVTGSKPRTGTFVTATSEEFPILILRDPPGDASASYYSQGHTTQTVFSGSFLENLSGTITNEVKAGITFDKGTPFFTTETKGVLTTKYGVEIGIQVGLGGELVFTTSTTETFATSADDVIVGQGGDVYLGVGLNLLFAKADDLNVDPNTCTIRRTQSVRFGGAEDAFNTVYLFTENHIENVIIPQLEELATLDPDSAVVFQSNIDSWERQITRNQTLKNQASFIENRSFSAGADFEFETTTVRDTTITGTIGIFAKSELALEYDFTESGSGSKTTFGANWGFEESATVTSTETGELTVGYNLSDDDVGDYFSVDIYEDAYYKTPVFKLRSGRSSCPWEAGTQPRDSVTVAVEPRNQVSVPANEAAAFTISITNESPSGELREYTIVPVTASNPYGARLNLDGSGFPTERSIFVDAFPNNVQTLTLTVERGPNRYFYDDIKLLVVPPCELANFRNGGALQFADTLSFSVSFDAPCSDVTLFQPKPDWRFNLASSEATDDTLTITLKDFEFAISESDSIQSVGAEYRRVGTENWFPVATEIPRADLPVLNSGAPGSVTIPWDVSGIPDGEYEIRAFTRCDQRGFSTVASGRIDRAAPEVFGDPEPADLELALGDEISVDFDEPIDCTTVTASRVSLVVDATSEPVIFDLQCDGDRILLDAADSELDLLEGQTLRARVEGVRDLAGNTLESPRTWTFEVRRSEFVWAKSDVSKEAPYRSPGNVSARLVNGTGENQTYELIDLPAWLSSAQAQGSVSAGGELAVAFAIDPSLAIGSYQATLNAAVPDSANAQFLLPLDVQVDIVCAPPTWVFEPSDYEYTMTAVLHVTVDDVPTADSDDVVAAFVGNQIRGIGSPIYVPEVDSWLVFMNVHSNIPVGENVRFRVYDSSDCRTYNSASNYLRFEADRRRGTPELPILLAAEDAPPQDVQLVSLEEGWTWFSLHRVALDMSVFSVLADLNPSEGDLIKSQFDGFAVFDPTVGWIGSLTELDVRSSYAIHLSDAGTLRHEGMAADPMIPIPVVDGWNWIGYPLPEPHPVGTALGALSNADGDVVKSQLSFSHFSEGDAAWLGGLDSMEPGVGHRLYLDDAFVAAGGPSFLYESGAPLLLARDGSSDISGEGATEDAAPIVLALWPDEDVDAYARGVLGSAVRGNGDAFLSSDDLTGGVTFAAGTSGKSTFGKSTFGKSVDPAVEDAFAQGGSSEENRPDWRMSFGYQHDMSVITSVELDGSDYDVSGALVAAFVGDELRGVTELQNVGLGRGYAFLTVHSDMAEGETIRFELYDPELDQVVDLDETVTFRVDLVNGSVHEPLLVHGTSNPVTPDVSELTYSLAPHYPNPVVASDMHIRWSIPTRERVVLGVYDVQGREVQRVVDGVMDAGSHVDQVDADLFSSGIYFYRMQAGEFEKVRRILIVH